jgi:hypothetical protein
MLTPDLADLSGDLPMDPIVEGSPAILVGWSGDSLLETTDGSIVPCSVIRYTVSTDRTLVWSESFGMEVVPSSKVRLSLHRPLAQDHVSRFLFGSSGAKVVELGPGQIGVAVTERAAAVSWDSFDEDALYVPELVHLPTAGREAWALWHCLRAFRAQAKITETSECPTKEL